MWIWAIGSALTPLAIARDSRKLRLLEVAARVVRHRRTGGVAAAHSESRADVSVSDESGREDGCESR
jgi:hypothetical protein